MSQVIVTGSDGQLGRSLRACQQLCDVVYLNRQDLDILDGARLRTLLRRERPQWLINCAAYTAVDEAECKREEAYAINSRAVDTLSRICGEVGTHLLHISTDYVFGGEGNRPHREEEVVHPEGVYAQSKRGGEVAVLSHGVGLVIRTSWLYSCFGRNFFRTVLTKSLRGEPLKVVADQIGTPTWAGHLAGVICQIVMNDIRVMGVYHYTDLGACSWYDFAYYLRRLAGASNPIEPIRSEEWPALAPRPRYSVLDSSQSRKLLGVEAVHWMEGVDRCYEMLRTLDNGTYYMREYK